MSWEYIAGFFDGEGSISHNGKGFRITISQTNKEVLEEIKNFTRLGKIVEVSKRKSHWKDAWVYYIAKQEEVYSFLISIEKYLIVKKELAALTIPRLKVIVIEQKRKANRRKIISKKAKKLRSQKLTYRQIGKKLNLDWGHTRRIILKK